MTASRISRRTSRLGGRPARLVALSALAGLGAAAVLAGCGAGQLAQTANELPGVPGINVNVGQDGAIQLRNIVIQYNNPVGYPAGGSAPLVVRIFNSGQQPVSLVGVDAPGVATRVALVGGAQPPAATPSPSPSGGAPGSPSAGASASPGGTPAPTATPPLVASAPIQVPIPPSSYAVLVPGQGQYLLLTGLTKPIVPGQNVDVTFRFSDGTTVTLTVPVDLPPTAAERGSPAPSGGHAE